MTFLIQIVLRMKVKSFIYFKFLVILGKTLIVIKYEVNYIRVLIF